VLCGNASQFQGDERDVIFLSMVNSPGEHALPLRRRDDQRKVFNVAASRARDQLWVVHSLEPGRDLKGGDLRLRLISHVEAAADDGEAAKTSKAKAKAKAPAQQRHFASELERELCHRLEDRGYLVLRHYPIGDGVIDLVVEGLGGRRVAVQCDGDRVLAGDIVEDQLAQQMSLRRLGWEFLRVRASDVVRDGEQAFARLFQRLGERGVRPGAAAAQDAGSSGISEPLHEKVIHRAEQIRRRWHVPSPAELLRLPNHADGDAQSGEGSGPESAGEVPERAEDGPAPQSTEPALDSDDGSDLD